MKNLKTLKEHLGFWMLYGLYFYALNALGNEGMTVCTALLSLPYFAFVFYTVNHIITRYMGRRRYVVGIMLLLLFYALSSLIIYFLSYGQQGALVYGKYVIAGYDFSWQEFLQTLLVLHGHFSLLALLYFHYREKLRASQQRLAEMERRLKVEEQKDRYEYVALAAQVPPHMMANIFQNLQQQLKGAMPELAQQVNRIYHLMHFYMKADDPEGSRAILLDDEVRAVQNYLTIQREVMERKFFVDFSTSGNMMRFSTAPTTLLTLVENAFKHGEIDHPGFPVRVQVQVERYGYRIAVENRKALNDTGLASHGHGLKNLKRRLAIQYGSEASVIIEDTDHNYRISIIIELNHLKKLQS